MNTNSRRSFLGSLAILSAGTVLSAVPGFITGESSEDSLQQNWKNFVAKNGGNKLSANESLAREALPALTKGHTVKAGKPVHFATEGLIALPCWIYWQNSIQPADMVVTFFSDEIFPKKIVRINRFELEGIQKLMASGKLKTLRSSLTAISQARPGKEQNGICIITKISSNQQPQVVTSFA